MSKKLISKLIVQLCEKNYSDANSTLQKVLATKISHKAQQTALSLTKESYSKKNNKMKKKSMLKKHMSPQK